MNLVQILLPLTDNDRKPFSRETFAEIKTVLTDKFKGVTAFSQSPAVGFWDDGDEVQKDKVILYEIMTEPFEAAWWHDFTAILETKLQQEKIALRWFKVSTF